MIGRKTITELSRNCRTIFPKETLSDFPMSVKSDKILFEGILVKRKRVILLTIGCGIGSCVMCPFPAESNINVIEENLINQFNNAFLNDDINIYNHITLFCNGNFFSNREISDRVIEYIFKKIGESKVNSVTVESLPQFISEEKIKRIFELLNGKKLQVYMGLQSSNDFVRRFLVNTTCTKQSFEKAAKILFKYNFSPAAFVLIKAPFLTNEEAKQDVINTLIYLDSIGVKHSTLCPTRIADNTLLKKIYDAGYYSPLNLWIVVDILIEYSEFGIGLPMVNTTELKQYVNEDSICAYSCEKCNKKIISAIERYLYSRDITELKTLYCDCKHKLIVEPEISKKLLIERINEFYEMENRKR